MSEKIIEQRTYKNRIQIKQGKSWRYKCNEEDCTKRTEGKTDKCIAHGGGKRCNEKDCDKGAASKSDKCVTHGGGKRCNEKDCDKGAVSKSDKCKAHGGGKKCNEKDCDKGAASKSDKCIAHGGGKRCNEKDCDKGAAGKSDKCKAHGGGNRCPNCIDWIDSRSGCTKYDGYCSTCFKRCFPKDKRSQKIYENSNEIKVRNKINEVFPDFIHDKCIYTTNCACVNRRRIDHRKLIGNTMFAIETDEFGHRSYDPHDEEIRYDDLFMIYSGKWIWIRFNPDSNRESNKTSFESKLSCLIQEMGNQLKRIENEENEELIEIIKMYL